MSKQIYLVKCVLNLFCQFVSCIMSESETSQLGTLPSKTSSDPTQARSVHARMDFEAVEKMERQQLLVEDEEQDEEVAS